MKVIFLFVTMLFMLSISGCAQNLNLHSVNPAEYKRHKILYEVTYNLDCIWKDTMATRTWKFVKGERFLPVDLSGKELFIKTAIRKSNGRVILPEGSLGLNIFPAQAIYYALIYPNGEFSSEDQIIVFYPEWGNLYTYTGGNNVCKLKNGKPLFKKVTNK